MDISYSHQILIFDTSVLINLIETGYCSEIFDTLNSTCLVSPQVLNELEGQAQEFCSRNNLIQSLVNHNNLSVVHLNEIESKHFITLISSDDPDALDDGEASTLALAKSRNAIAIIDEKKGTRIASECAPPVMTASTVELLHWISLNNINKLPLNDIVLNALIQAKMRVPHTHENWVLELIPKQMLSKCTSLKKRIRDNGITLQSFSCAN